MQPVVSESPYEADADLRVVKFDRTPIMSTYLVAYVVGEFDYVEERSTDGVLVRVYTPVGKKEQGRFGLYVAAKVLPYYKEYFGVEYPLPKMDLVAVADFAAGKQQILYLDGCVDIHHKTVFCRCYGKLGSCYLQRNLSFGR